MMLGVVIQCDMMPSSATPTRSNVVILASASHLTHLSIRRIKQSVWCIAMLPNIPSTHGIWQMSLITEQDGAYIRMLLGKWLNMQRISIKLKKGFHWSRHNKIKRRVGDIRVFQMETGADFVGVSARARRGNGERNCSKYHTVLSCTAMSAVLSSESTCTFAMETSPVKLWIAKLHTTTNITEITARNDILASHEQ